MPNAQFYNLRIRNFILDTLSPISCISCGQKDLWLCDQCAGKIILLDFQVCPYCEREITEQGKVCPSCKNKFLSQNKIIPLDNLLTAASYTNPLISRLVHLYKYNFVEDLSIHLGYLLLKNLLKNNIALPDIIVPVPLHPRRLRWRGFNQSYLLAKFVSENLTPGLTIPVSNEIIYRKKYTPPQMSIKNYSERQKNIANAFYVNHSRHSSDNSSHSSHLKDKTILLIDDIATTGSTLIECAKALKQNGAQKIIGAVIARQEIK